MNSHTVQEYNKLQKQFKVRATDNLVITSNPCFLQQTFTHQLTLAVLTSERLSALERSGIGSDETNARKRIISNRGYIR